MLAESQKLYGSPEVEPQNARVCSAHFNEGDFVSGIPRNLVALNSTAATSLNWCVVAEVCIFFGKTQDYKLV